MMKYICIISPPLLFGLLVVVLPGVCQGEWISGHPKAFLDAHTIYDRWIANYRRMDSVQYKCSYILINVQGKAPENLMRCSHVERIQDGNRFWVRYSASTKGFTDSEFVNVNTYNGYLCREYKDYGKSGEIYRGLRSKPMETDDPMGIFTVTAIWRWDGYNIKSPSELLQWALKLKEDFPAGAPLFAFEYTRGLKEGYIWVRPYLDSVAGQWCHVMAVVFPGAEGYLYWFAHEKGMLLMRKEYYRRGENLDERIEVEQITGVTTPGGEVWYPQVATRELNYNDYNLTYKLNVYEYIPGVVVPSNTFDFAFPDGTEVSDEVIGMQYKKDGPYKKDLHSLFAD